MYNNHGEPIDIHYLLEKYKWGVMKRCLDFFAHSKELPEEITATEFCLIMTSSGLGLGHLEAIHVFKVLDRAKCGRYKVGRRGGHTRFQFSVSSRDLGKAVVIANEVKAQHDSEILKHTFILRPQVAT